MTKSERVFVNLLALMRSAGALAFVAPGIGAGVLHLPDEPNSRYVVRIFAARNIAFVMGLLGSTGDARRGWLRAGVVCDALDVGAAVLGGAEGMGNEKAKREAFLAFVFTALGTMALRSVRSEVSP